MFNKIFIWTGGIYLCLTILFGLREQYRKHGETFRAIGVHTEQTIMGKRYHIVATRNSDKMIFTFDRFSNSLKTGEEFDVVVGFIVPKTTKSPALREE